MGGAADKEPRRVVVVREGPPVWRAGRSDVAVLALGALLLLVAVALPFVLPEEEVVPPQFRVHFEALQVRLDNVSVPLQEGQLALLEFEAPATNVTAVSFSLLYADDLAASLPDRVTVELLDSEGVVLVTDDVRTPAPQSDGQAVGSYQAVPFGKRYTARVLDHPADTILDGLAEAETPAQAAARLAGERLVPSSGTWVVRVTLTEAGDCPGPEAGDPRRSAACVQAEPSGVDAGNDVTVAGFTFTRYEAQVRLLDEEDSDAE